MDNSLSKIFFLLALFVGGLIWFLMMLVVKIFITNLKGNSIWTISHEAKELPLDPSFR